MSVERQLDLSVVLPVYKCGPALAELHERLTHVLAELRVTYEIIFVDDGCPDGGWDFVAARANHDSHVVGIKLSRNFGQAVAIAAGLSEAKGARVIVMDADLQDPPEAIPILWERAQQGASLVFGKRAHEHQSTPRMIAGKVYFRFLRLISGRSIDPNYGTFSLMSREVVDAYLQFREPNRHFLFILYWLGFEACDAEYARNKRAIGKSSYRLLSLLRHSFQGVLFYSQSLVRLLFLCSAAMAVTAFLMLLVTMMALDPLVRQSLTSVFFLFLALAVAICGVFVSQIFEQTKARPLFVVMKRLSRHSQE